MRNAAAALVAIVCWAGLAIQFSATYGQGHPIVGTLWIMAPFFTVLTNLAVAAAMTWVALGRRGMPGAARLAGAAALTVGAIGLVLGAVRVAVALAALAHVAGLLQR